ncbi:hypothetical protein CLAFUW4_10688 [Fulvia fulva]|uniref:Uncharacterized protein n=1 Tax=Passalora fulva TaxID=5499 RepID=A0A9Q8LFY0_PASFU|nr:uncharacterized protein CLAFUR5_05302 [Fulvia fulva]KAK4615754.1 hypothetical protein CLAFUR4_10693 [Fulvia fulva]KAK4617184.1 hypothetical protein CLAFUR0_10550 [Fulvia fulva]UJO16732.1 hypothetical protein CLAFUR5_05302 [Fulvia fulva]WPV19613.1 hypothetical protein CLAFUW4_10688 [Fulvia fulva]WPV33855.1 hypothetical protein CLAFUW7_10690 [Fulvia fulva]
MPMPARTQIYDSDWEEDGMSDGEVEYRRGLDEEDKTRYNAGEDEMDMSFRANEIF